MPRSSSKKTSGRETAISLFSRDSVSIKLNKLSTSARMPSLKDKHNAQEQEEERIKKKEAEKETAKVKEKEVVIKKRTIKRK